MFVRFHLGRGCWAGVTMVPSGLLALAVAALATVAVVAAAVVH